MLNYNPCVCSNCDGIPGSTGKPILGLIPCACPPPRDQFISALNANVAAGHMVNNTPILAPFPTGDSKAEQQARIATLLSTLQNLRGPGVGCPAVSTVYGQKQQEINALPN
ncbi:hypothetical protein GSI_11276 [Ganoderma sinense ZZ0214-1]|uniref:Uncharacterized protein n=1 Tax=Ganoderma sinense ZZ0214-1 TaxID=1077348 RepID=A0A2G8RYQ6_9APHY|nr:hypothetical protein GSI_11276 [Ganoderma sinense ZZ0214-1]